MFLNKNLKKTNTAPNRRFRQQFIMPLEPRIMFDAAAVATVDVATASAPDPPPPAADSGAEQSVTSTFPTVSETVQEQVIPPTNTPTVAENTSTKSDSPASGIYLPATDVSEPQTVAISAVDSIPQTDLTSSVKPADKATEPILALAPEESETGDLLSIESIQTTPGSTDSNIESPVHAVAFVAPSVTNSAELLSELSGKIEVVLLQEENSVQQIGNYLSEHGNVNSLHIFSHGTPGSISLGSTAISAETIDTLSSSIEAWRQGLTDDADILLYGCNIGAGSEGEALLARLAELTGADVAASDDPTGSEIKGGDWLLEKTVGTIESEMLSVKGYEGLLAAPVNTVPVAQTVVEDNTKTFSGNISIADADGTIQSVTLSVSHGTLTLSGTTGLTLTGDGTASISITAGTIANINSALNGMVYRPSQDYSGADTLTIATNDGTTTDTDTVGITVTANATAPVLTLPAAAQTVTEDTATYLNFSGANAITLTDSDSNDLQTLTLTVSHGSLNLKTDVAGGVTSATNNGTASVTLTGTASQLSATLADAQGVQYTSALNYNSSAALGAEAISFALSDGVGAHNQSGSIAINVTQANDAPDLSTGAAATVQEGSSVSFSRDQLASSNNALDVDIQTGQQVINQLMVKIDSLPASGTLTYNSGVVIVGSVIPVTALGNLQYTHNGTDITSNQNDSFNVTVSDGGGGSTSGSVSITITPKNVAPTISGAPALIEGQVKVVAPTINLGDGFDTLSNSTIVIDNVVTGGQGTLFIDANNNNVVDGGEDLGGSTTLDATQRANLSTQLKFFQNGYEPNTPAAVSPSYRITVTDAGGGTGVPSAAIAQTINISVDPNNDDPTLTNTHDTIGTAQAVQEGNIVVITNGMLQISDADLNPANTALNTPANQLVYTIGTRPTQGEIQLYIGGVAGYGGTGWITLGDGGRFTQAQVNAGDVRYYQTVNVADGAATLDGFTFTVRDSAFGYDVWTDPANPTSNREGGLRSTPTGAIATQQFYLSINPLADAASPRTDLLTDTYVGGPRDATPGYSVGGNVLYTFEQTADTLNTNTGAVGGTWSEANVGAAGGYPITSEMLSYTITRTDTKGTPATGDDIIVTVPEAETVYTITIQPPNGTVQRFVGGSWQVIPTYGQFTQADITANNIRFVHDGGEDHIASFNYTVSDGTPDHHDGTFGLDITPTNDRPTGSSGSAAQVTEGSGNAVRLGTGILGMSDVDLSLDGKGAEGAADFLWFKVTGLAVDGAATQRGVLQRWDGDSWETVDTGTWLPRTLLTATADGTASGLRYLHDGSEPLAYTGGPKVTFTYIVRDDLADPGDAFATNATAPADVSGSAQSNQSAPATATINIIPVNNAPLIADKPGDADPTIGGTIASGGATTGVNNVLTIAVEGGDSVISNAYLVAIDADNTTVQRQYIIKTAPTQGILMLNGNLVGVGSTFTQDDIDNNRVTYRHNGNEIADPTTDGLGTYHDKFHFVVSDAVSDDTGSGAPSYNTFLITLTPTNDAPTVAGPSGIILIDSATPANNPVSGFSVADPDLTAGVQSGETDFVQATVRILDSAGNPATDYAAGFGTGGVSIGYTTPGDTSGLWAVTQNGSNNILQIQGSRAQVNAALAGLTVTFANDANSMYKVQVIADDRMRDVAGALATAGSDANGGELNQGTTAGAAPTAVPGTVYDWATAVAVPVADPNIAAATVDIRASLVNQDATFTGPAAQTLLEDVRTKITNTFDVADPESAAFNTPVTVTVSVPGGHGTLGIGAAGAATSLTPSGGQAVTISGDNSATITLTGRAADIKALLNGRNFADGVDDANGGLYYTSPTNGNHDYNGASADDVTLTLALADTGSRFGSDVGAGSVANNPANIVIPITITPINDAPTVSAGSTPVAISGTTAVTGFAINDIDSTDGSPLNATTGESDFMQATIRLLPAAGTTPLTALQHAEVVFSSSTAGGVTVDATYTGNGTALVIRGTLAEVNTYLSGLQVALSGSLLNDNNTYRVQVIADDRLRDGAGALDGSNAANGGLNSDGGSGTANVPATAVDPYTAVPTLAYNVASNTRVIMGSNVNEAPGFGGLDAAPTFAENGAAVVLDANATISDPELTAYSNWNASVLTLVRNTGANAEDVFGVTGSGSTGINFNGANIRNGATVVGTYTNAGGTLAITFNSSATNTVVESVLRAITYSNSNNNPPSSVTINYTINDGDTDADRAGNGQGTGGALTGSGSITVGITPTNDAPTLAGLTAKSFTEDGAAVVIGTNAVPGDPELTVFAASAGNWGNATLTISRNGGASAEDSFSASGTLSALTEGSALTDGATTIGTVTTNSAGTLKITFAEDVTTAQVQAAIRQIAYSNSRQTLAAAATSTVTLNWLLEDQDTDGDRLTNPQGTGGNKSVTVAQTITLNGVNDAPVLADTVLTINQAEDAAVPSGAVGTLISALATAGNITDSDTGAVRGLAVTTTDSSHGTWYYSINGGTNWFAFTAADTTARLLNSTARVYFKPTGDWHGSIASGLTVRAWDSTSGANGGTADLSAGGSTGTTTAFSTATDTIALTVTPVNDAPTFSGTTTVAATTENTTSAEVSASTVAAALTYGDTTDNQTASGGNSTATTQTAIAITGNAAAAGEGKWQYTTNGTAWNDVSTAIDNTTAVVLDLGNGNHKIRFVPTAGYYGTPGALTLRAADGTWNNATGTQNINAMVGATGAWSASTGTLGITVGAVNTAPVINGLDASPAFTEGVDTASNRSVTGSAVIVDSSVTIADTEIVTNSEDTFGGTTLIVARDNGAGGFSANSQDLLNLSTAGTVGLTGTVISVGGTDVADLTSNSDGQMVITFRAVASPADVNAVASAVTYAIDSDTPPANVTLRYRFNDDNQATAQGSGGSLTGDAVITVTVTAKNDLPLAADDINSITKGTASVTANVVTTAPGQDSDPENDALAVTAIRTGTEAAGAGSAGAVGVALAGSYGTLAISADGSYIYTLDNSNPAVSALLTGQTLLDHFTYTVDDGNSGTDVAQLAITINGLTPAPPAAPVDPAPPAPPVDPAPPVPPVAQDPPQAPVPPAPPVGQPSPTADSPMVTVFSPYTFSDPASPPFDMILELDDSDMLSATDYSVNSPGNGVVSLGDGAFGNNSEYGLYLVKTPSSQEVLTDEVASFNLPAGTFKHSSSNARVSLEATLSDGRPLPGWLIFDPDSGKFTGKPPKGSGGSMDIKVMARDDRGNLAFTQFMLHITELESNEAQTLKEEPASSNLDSEALDSELKEPQKELQKQPKPRESVKGRPSLSEQLRQQQFKGRNLPIVDAAAKFPTALQ